ncbi:SET domain-containing protein [Panus rudis PR-1116 ss-1]|nr:SET domain-containing protein [Panus rudis PR-1116 ss-1]
MTTLPPDCGDVTIDYPTVECFLTSRIKKAILALPNFPEAVKRSALPAYEIRVHKDFGLGMFANRDLDVGDLIVAERPLLITQIMQMRPQTMRDAIDRMEDSRRDAFYALRNVKGYTRDVTQGLSDTNAVGIPGLPGNAQEVFAAVCEAISRINHSCTPNCAWSWHLRSFAMEVRALKPIKKGEQIFAGYTSPLDPRSHRREFLSRRYKFHCMCSSCSLPDEDSKASDARRARLKAISQDQPGPGYPIPIFAWLSKSDNRDHEIVDRCMEAIHMMEQEQLWDVLVWPAILERLVIVYCCLADAENASFWARKASALFKASNFGDDGGWSAVAERPQKTKWWGARQDGRRIWLELSQGISDRPAPLDWSSIPIPRGL